MTTFYSEEANGYIATVPPSQASGAVHNANLRRYRAKITLASQTTSDTIVCFDLPRGVAFAYGVLTSDVSLSTSTIAIGVSGSTGKYRAAATFTATNTPTPFGTAAGVSAAALTAGERVFITIATATLPSSGTLVVDFYVSGT